jgi:Zn-dependent protease with chaperone function
MANILPDSVEPYENISSKAYEHPADRAATAALKAVPMLDTVVRKLVEWRYERALRQFFLGNSVKVGEHQLPELWTAHIGVCRILDMERYDLYVSSGVRGGAQAIGSGKPMIVVDSQLLEWLGAGEQRTVLAHELGHILSDHVMYMTALNILLSVAGPLPFFLGIPFRAVRAVLLEWYRAAELSCDRAATLAVRDPQIVCRTLMVTAGAMPAERLNLDAFMAQAMEYEAWDDPSDRVRRFFQEIGQDHTYAVRRVSEVMKWVQAGEYDRIVRGEYRRRDEDTNVREEAGDAVQFYAERFRTIFRDAGDNLAKAGSQIGGAADQLADWIRTRSGPGGFAGGFGGPGGGRGGSGGGGAGGGRGTGEDEGTGGGGAGGGRVAGEDEGTGGGGAGGGRGAGEDEGTGGGAGAEFDDDES